ncbi:Golgi transport complex subunit 5-domain-containing protein [Zychaea mexicana]|uniref:Golgi transport complex subunit 5-domain-containing protein n=1 Tax=Zychaea mexicana TaxID=64656 RepID=UPI0022FDED00|nr:Golgi transport complex subunit 5-domain-containing protein [Zychaea mexicana]KAI9491511.1 Golgi transport complex subunit 5-domain-containing protein [Zychaea mexicana]
MTTSSNTAFALQEADNYIDYETFLSDNFDANKYADSIIHDGGDAATALSKLAFSITSIDKQIQNEIASNYDTLLGQVRGIRELEIVLSTVQSNIIELKTSLNRLAGKIRDPYQQLNNYTIQLEHLHQTADLLRRLHRFVVLVRRLENQLGRDMAAAALTISEIGTISQESDFDEIDIVTQEQAFLEKAQTQIEVEATTLLREGVTQQNQSKMAAGLQILYNMKQMETQVQALVTRMLDDLAAEIRHAIDMSSLQKQMRVSSSGPAVRRVNNEPTFGNQSQWQQAIWKRMETLFRSMADGCIQIYALEKVLEIKKDSFLQVSYLEEVLKTMDATSLASRFWRMLAMTFEKELREATKTSGFLRNTFVTEYGKLHRLLQEFLSQVAVHNGVSLSEFSQSPECIIMQRSISIFDRAAAKSSRTANNVAVAGNHAK